MMDIVEELCQYGDAAASQDADSAAEMAWKAAEEIERLREQVADLKTRLHHLNEELLRRG